MQQITLKSNPWQYGIINNTYEKDLFLKARKELEELAPELIIENKYSSCITIQLDNPYAREKFPETIKCIQSLDLNELFESQRSKFKYIRPYNKLRVTNTISITLNYPHDIHHETRSKVFSLVTYFSPNFNNGTFLYNLNKEHVVTTDWAPNNSMFFCGQDNTTWHSFFAEDVPRITINRFLER